MGDMAVARLEMMGYLVSEQDRGLLDFVVRRVEQGICSRCNTLVIPCGLVSVAVERICGGFLFEKKSRGDLDGIDMEEVVKQVSVGDTTVVFDTTLSSAAAFDSWVMGMMQWGEGELVCYRKIKW